MQIKMGWLLILDIEENKVTYLEGREIYVLSGVSFLSFEWSIFFPSLMNIGQTQRIVTDIQIHLGSLRNKYVMCWKEHSLHINENSSAPVRPTLSVFQDHG